MNRRQANLASYLILEKDEKVLLAKRKNTGYEDEKYGLPAGHLEEGEFPDDCAIREAKEEVGVKVNKKDIQFIEVVFHTAGNWGHYVDFFFRADRWEGEPMIMEADKCSEIE